MSKLFKRTKILATIGPAVMSEEAVTDLIMAGVNGCRLNFSHGNYMERDEQIAWIRSASAKKGRSVAIVQDLQGPKIRLGELKGNHLDVHAGDELILDFACEAHNGGKTLPVQYNLADKVKVGEPLFLFDGKIKSSVIDIPSKTAIKIRVENDGYLMSKKGLNLPDTDFGGDIITDKDMADIEFGAGRDFDYVALSFVQSASDIDKLRQILLTVHPPKSSRKSKPKKQSKPTSTWKQSSRLLMASWSLVATWPSKQAPKSFQSSKESSSLSVASIRNFVSSQLK